MRISKRLPNGAIKALINSLTLSHKLRGGADPRLPVWLSGVQSVSAAASLSLIHDLGVTLSDPKTLSERPTWLPPEDKSGPYMALLNEVAGAAWVRNLRKWGGNDALIGVLIARLLVGCKSEIRLSSDPRLGKIIQEILNDRPLEEIWNATTLAEKPSMSSHLPQAVLDQIRSNLHQLSADEVRFMCQFGPRLSGDVDPRELYDLFNLFGLPPDVRAMLLQAMQLIPKLSQKQNQGGAQAYPTGGYSGLDRVGSLDSLLLTELAYDDDYFMHRFHNREALYYGRERVKDQRRQLVYLVVQSGLEQGPASEILSKGMALALNQLLKERGYEVLVSFAGAHLSDPKGIVSSKDIFQILYYQVEAFLNSETILSEVLRNLRAWRETYQRVQVMWVIDSEFDADLYQHNEKVYRQLTAECEHQAWYIQVNKDVGQKLVPVNPPSTARYLGNWTAWSCDQISFELPSSPLTSDIGEFTDERWQAERDEIERYGFKMGKHDVLHFGDERQWEAWHRLSRIEENEKADDYMRSLAPAEMIYIPPGNFLMGSSDDDPEAAVHEKPQHWVYLPGYYIDRYPVINRLYAGFIEAGGYDRQELWNEAGWEIKEQNNWRVPQFWGTRKHNREQQPVVGVSWYEALACARWLGKMLPSEVQWEKAAGWDPVKGEKSIYPWGNELIGGNFEGMGAPEIGQNSPERDSPYGVADMGGVVYNWCTTAWDEHAYLKPMEERKKSERLNVAVRRTRSRRTRSRRTRSRGTTSRTRKGGYGGGANTEYWRCGYRVWNLPGYRLNYNGFRCITPHILPADPFS